MGYEFLDISVSDGVAVVTINRPEVLNGLHPESHREMTSYLQPPAVFLPQYLRSAPTCSGLVTGATFLYSTAAG